MAGTSLIWLWLVRLQGWRSNKTKTCRQGRGKRAILSEFDKIAIKEGLSPANPQSFIDYSWRMTSLNMLLHSLGELHKGTSWMTRGERMRTTLEPTLGGGGQIGEQVDRQGGGLLIFCRQTLWKAAATWRLVEEEVLWLWMNFFEKLVAQQQLLWCDPGPWRWQGWKGSQNSSLHPQHFLQNDNQRRLGWNNQISRWLAMMIDRYIFEGCFFCDIFQFPLYFSRLFT